MHEDQLLVQSVWPDWELLEAKPLGSGSYGVVYHARKRGFAGDFDAAIKIIAIENDTNNSGFTTAQIDSYLESIARDYSREIQLLKSLQGNSNIVSIDDYQVVQNKDGKPWHVLIRMELLKSLYEDLEQNGITEDRIIRVGIDLCKALEVCEKHQIVHRDIKPGNVLVNRDGIYKLGDFGASCQISHTTKYTLTGTPDFMAPEVFHAALSEANFRRAQSADIYSVGMLLYWMANGQRQPFIRHDGLISQKEIKEAFEKRMNGNPLEKPANVSPELGNVILKACAYKSSDRYPSPMAFREALEKVTSSSSGRKNSSFRKMIVIALCILFLAGICYIFIRKPEPISEWLNLSQATTESTDTPAPTPTPTPTPSPKDVPSPTSTPTPTSIPTLQPTDTPSLTSTPTQAPTPSPIPTDTPSPTPTPTPTSTPTLHPTDTPSPTPTPTQAPTPSPIPTDTPSPILTPTPTTAPTSTPTSVPTPTPTLKPTYTPSPTPKPTQVPTPTSTPTPMPTSIPTQIHVGDVILFGSYEQDGDPENGKEPVEWIVLKSENGKAYMISRYILDAHAFGSKEKNNVGWKESLIREWLNAEFLSTIFSVDDQKALSRIDTDPISLISENEAYTLFANLDGSSVFSNMNSIWFGYPTRYADRSVSVNAQNGTAWWWTRTKGKKYDYHELCVDAWGNFHDFDESKETGGVRPFISVYTDSLP